MLAKIITPGDRIELVRPVTQQEKNDEKEEKIRHDRPYISQVYDILDDEQLKIAMPIIEGRVIPLPLHGRYNACFFTSGGLYQAKAVITDRYKEDGLYILVIELTSELKKFQRRQYFRLEYTMDIQYKTIDAEQLMAVISDGNEMESLITYDMKNGIVLDLSGGGVRFTSNELLEKNSNIVLSINIGVTQEVILGVAANIISSKKVENRDKIYEHRAEFRNLRNTSREMLIKFIFETERRLRKRD